MSLPLATGVDVGAGSAERTVVGSPRRRSRKETSAMSPIAAYDVMTATQNEHANRRPR